MRKSKFALQTFFKKHKTAVIIATAVSAGAFAYVTRESPKIQVPRQEGEKVQFCYLPSLIFYIYIFI